MLPIVIVTHYIPTSYHEILTYFLFVWIDSDYYLSSLQVKYDEPVNIC